MPVGTSLKNFCRKLLKFEWNKTVSNAAMSRSPWPSSAPLLLLRVLHTVQSKFCICWRSIAFPWHCKKISWIYLDIAAFQDFKVSLLLPHFCQDFVLESIATRREGSACLRSYGIARPMIWTIMTSLVNRAVKFQWPLKDDTKKVFHPMIAQRIWKKAINRPRE